MHNYERGIISLTELPEFAAKFEYAFKRVGGNPENANLEDVMGGPDENIAKAIKRLKETGYKVALLTNNGYWSSVKQRSVIMKDIDDFDVVRKHSVSTARYNYPVSNNLLQTTCFKHLCYKHL